ncbi:MAG: flagellar assembly protein FliH [Deltaproteobacteria bacterium]|jgi:flagellar assembly protein FliH|nr:flagellar assembly protein FliH [Deltaproteobacteria bacterium]
MADEQGRGADSPKWGRIFMGNRITELHDVEDARSRAWDAGDESAYLARVRAKAAEKAGEIVARAEAEASGIRDKAYEEGYAEGIKKAAIELEEARRSLGEAVSAVLAAIREEAPRLSAAWRDDLAALVRLAVEKAFAVTLSEERGKILEALYLQAVQSLEDSRNFDVRVNPEDEACMEDIISLGSAGRPGLESWRVKADPSITPGGLIVESSSSLADNTAESRMAAVNAVLAGLNVPENKPL